MQKDLLFLGMQEQFNFWKKKYKKQLEEKIDWDKKQILEQPNLEENIRQ